MAWIPHKPEQRLSIAIDRFLDRALVPPFYCTAIHDADDGGRTDRQRQRDVQRGVKSGQLDWEVWQGPNGLARRLELKRGANKPSPNQVVTIQHLTACGAPPVVAWTLREAFEGLRAQGFRFLPNVETTLQHCEELLAGWDRDAEARKAEPTVTASRKPASKKPTAARLRRIGAIRAGVMF